MPPFRQQSSYNAYAEGWALYSESLGKDIGFYQYPYSDFGRLPDELLRALPTSAFPRVLLEHDFPMGPV